MSGLVREWGITAMDWINDNGFGWAIKLIVFILILVAFRTLSRLTRRWAERGLSNVQLSLLLRQMIVSSDSSSALLCTTRWAISPPE